MQTRATGDSKSALLVPVPCDNHGTPLQKGQVAQLSNTFDQKCEDHELLFALCTAWHNLARPKRDRC
jgi:hypothetical protein